MNEAALDSFWLVECFARAAERMNGFGRTMGSSERFNRSEARTGADIRFDLDGARLEKWVELDVRPQDGLVYCWWLELSRKEDDVVISSSVSLSHDDFFQSFGDQLVTSKADLSLALERAIDWLEKQSPPESLFGR